MIRSPDDEATRAEVTRPEAAPRRVLIATEGSATSASAERAGVELAARFDASLILLSVIDPSRLRLAGGLFHTRVDQVRTEREVALARIVDGARKQGVSAQYLIWEGEPGASVIEAAEAEGADVIVVGSHARGPVGRRLLGSVSAYVLEHGTAPVLVVRPGQHLDDVWTTADQRRIRRARARSTIAAVIPDASRKAGLG